MTPAKFVKFVRKQTKTNATTYSDASLLEDMNTIKDDICAEIAKINEDIFGMLAYRNLVKDQREYSIPENVLNNLKYFEVDVLGDSATQTNPRLVTAKKHLHADEFDLTQYERSTDEAEIRRMYQFRKPGYDIFRNALWVYTGEPIIDVRNGLKLYYIRYPDDITLDRLTDNLTDLSNDLVRPISSGVPRQFHLVWATMVIVLFKNSKEKPIPLTQSEKNVGAELGLKLDALSGLNLDRDQRATVPLYANGEDY